MTTRSETPDSPAGASDASAAPVGAAASVLRRLDMRNLDAATIAAGTASRDLMERAGVAIAEALLSPEALDLPRIPGTGPALADGRERIAARPRLLILAGNGNNGGDGFVVARLLAAQRWLCTVALCAGEPREGGDAAANLALWRSGNGRTLDASEGRQALERGPAEFDLVLDALLGTGLDRPVDSALAELMRRLNATALPVVAVDIPSGLCADSGKPLGYAVRARATVTLGAYKPGLFLAEGPDYSGRVVVADIGLLGPAAASVEPVAVALDAASMRGLLGSPAPTAHKGSRGHVLVVAGSLGKSGAALLCAKAALRAGAGLVTLALPRSQQPVAATALAEVMTAGLAEDETGAFSVASTEQLQALLDSADSVVFGPGVGTGEGAGAVLRLLLTRAGCPVVIDADGLNLMARLGSAGRRILAARVAKDMGAVVLTPHPGEMGRLVGLRTAEVQDDRLNCAVNLAQSQNCIVVLKGAGTIVSDGVRSAFNNSGNAGMAAAGMGDVLAGAVAALAGRCSDAFDAACLAVYCHGRAGDRLAFEGASGARRPGKSPAPRLGFLAGEVADALPSALAEVGA